MLIGEIGQQTGVARDTIRYYECLGLLQADGRPGQFNNYKAYPAATITRLGLIQQAKSLGTGKPRPDALNAAPRRRSRSQAGLVLVFRQHFQPVGNKTIRGKTAKPTSCPGLPLLRGLPGAGGTPLSAALRAATRAVGARPRSYGAYVPGGQMAFRLAVEAPG